MGRKIWIDFETRSEVPIDRGIPNYLSGKKADILMMGWAIDDQPAQLWLPEMRIGLPFIIQPEDKLYAFNAGSFDYRVWNLLGPKYYFPPVPLERWVDVMALCGRHTYPQSLDEVSHVLKLKVGKDSKGKALIKKICVPPFKYTAKEWEEFKSYCKDDVTSMRYLVKALPADALTPDEQEVWLLTQQVNFEGLPVDIKLARRIVEVLEFANKKINKNISDLTGGDITAVTQVARIKTYCKEQGYEYDTLGKDFLEAHLGSAHAESLPKDVRELLQMRLDFASSAVAKFRKVLEMAYQGRVYDNLIYYKANTGRWAGAAFQAHNLIRDSNKTPDEDERVMASFYDASILKENPIQAAKTLVRPVIRAPKGKRLGVADYHSIENVLLAWVAGAEDLLELHRRGLDEYIDFATQVFNISYEAVTKDQRTFCKPPVLGAGYGLGPGGLRAYGEKYGIYFTPQESESLIHIYRSTRPSIPKLWWGLKDCAILAMRNRGKAYTYRGCTFKFILDRNKTPWLTLRLPSNRTLLYNHPELREDKYGLIVTHMGIDSYSKKWKRKKVTPGRFTENVIQALARDLMFNGKKKLREEGYKVLLSIHDEAICELDKQEADIQKMCEVMCRLPKWAEGLPLRAEGEILKRYRKI